MRILLVDDDEDSRRLFEAILRRAGHEVIPVSDGNEALAEAARGRPDFVLSDVLMPHMDGYTLCRVIKGEPSLRDIPVILYSGVYKGEADAAKARTLGAAGFVSKPVEPTALLEAIERILGQAPELEPFARPAVTSQPRSVMRSYDERLIHQMERQAEQLLWSQDALIREKRLSEAILEGVPAGIAFLDANLILRRCNRAYGEYIDTYSPFSAEQAIGKSFYEYVPGSREQVEELFRRVTSSQRKETHQAFRLDLRAGGSGPVTYWDVSVAPLLGPEDRVEGIILITKDVTELKETQDALRNTVESLDRARALETVGVLAQGIAHEVRNPLFAIEVNAGALARQLTDRPEFRPFLENIHEHVQRLDLLMRDLLEMGRPLGENEFLECSIQDLLQKAVDDVGDSVPSSRGRVFLEAPKAPCRILAAPAKLTQAFAHLVSNSLQNSPADGRVFVTLSERPGSLEVRVQDEGHGISETVRGDLFKPFVTTHAGRKGLGLALIRHYLAAHGGVLTAANNDPPPGATFVASLPSGEREAGGG